MAGSRSARRWSSRWRRRSAPMAASSAGSTTSGATPTARGRPPPAACWPAREVDPPFVPPKPRPIPMPEGGGARNGNPIYALPNARGTFHFVEQMPVRVSALRGLGAQMNVFAIESFMDELAEAAGADPVAFRLAHLHGRARARGRADWRPTASAGRARRWRGTAGFAFARYKNLASLLRRGDGGARSTATRGEIHVPRVVAAVDSGEAVNPDGIRNQIEGGIVQSLSWTTREAVGVRRDASHQLRLERLSDPALPRGARPDRGPCDRPAEASPSSAPARPRRGRRRRRSPMPSPMRWASACATCRCRRSG